MADRLVPVDDLPDNLAGQEVPLDDLPEAFPTQQSRQRKAPDPYKGMSLDQLKKQYRGARLIGADQNVLSALADAYVNKEQQRASNSEDYFGQGVLNAADNFVRDFARGVPIIGGANDEISAALNTIGGGDYQENLDYERARNRFNDEQFGALSTGTQIAGGIASGVGAARFLGLGGAATQPQTAARVVMPTFGQAAKAGAVASLGSARRIFARGEGGLGNRAGNAAIGAVIGAPLGFAAPYAGAAVSRGVQKLTDYLASDQMLKKLGVSRDAANILLRQLSADDTLTTEGADRIARGGPDAMLADAGGLPPNFSTRHCREAALAQRQHGRR
jgi:hypothetical protein